jgi:hypothetical protein
MLRSTSEVENASRTSTAAAGRATYSAGEDHIPQVASLSSRTGQLSSVLRRWIKDVPSYRKYAPYYGYVFLVMAARGGAGMANARPP